MIGYTKMFAGMLDSSVWQLSKDARLLWVTMLLKKDRDQVVRAAVPGLAHAARLTVSETEAALLELSQPDQYSQSREAEGRRIVRTDAGWLVVNGTKYRDMLSAEDRREYQRIKQREYRERKKKLKPGHELPGEAAAVRAMNNGDDQAADRITTQSLPPALQ